MRIMTQTLVLGCIMMMAASAMAQPKASTRRGKPASHPAKERRADRAEQNNARKCESQRAVLTQDERQLERYRSELAGMDSEIAQLRRQLDQMNRDRIVVDRQVKTFDSRVKQAEANYTKQCAADPSCGQYEQAAVELDGRGQTVEREIDVVRTSMATSQRDVQALERRIEPLRREYSQKRCNDLVPGETSQTDIDRCAAIFSEWNRLQADLNSQNHRIISLKTSYDQLLSELRSLENRSRSYQSYLTQNCVAQAKASGRKPHQVRNYSDVRGRAENLGKELDQLITDVTRLRGVRINVEAR